MSLRRSTRVPKPKVAWEAKDVSSTALHTKFTTGNPQTVQKNALNSVTLGPLPEIVESNDNALFNGERDLRTPTATWAGKGVPSAASDPKITKKTARTAQFSALQPITVGPLPKAVELSEEELPELPDYKPPLDLQFQASQSLITGLSELETFQRVFTPQIVDRIVIATNSYAERVRRIDEDTGIPFKRPRPWKSVNSADIWRFIGSLLYMGYKRLQNHEKHWSEGGRLASCISLVRWEQIHRYLTFRDEILEPKEEKEIFAWKVEPIASIVKQNCKDLWSPSSHLSIDEAMIAYRGRTLDKVKLPKKPIKEGYKVWVLGDGGYVYD